jgi:hypothetical protein
MSVIIRPVRTPSVISLEVALACSTFCRLRRVSNAAQKKSMRMAINPPMSFTLVVEGRLGMGYP